MLAAQARSHDLSHAWQYEIRLKNFDQDLEEAGLTEIEIKSLSRESSAALQEKSASAEAQIRFSSGPR